MTEASHRGRRAGPAAQLQEQVITHVVDAGHCGERISRNRTVPSSAEGSMSDLKWNSGTWLMQSSILDSNLGQWIAGIDQN